MLPLLPELACCLASPNGFLGCFSSLRDCSLTHKPAFFPIPGPDFGNLAHCLPTCVMEFILSESARRCHENVQLGLPRLAKVVEDPLHLTHSWTR